MKLDRFLKLIREEVRKVVREELKTFINESSNINGNPLSYKRSLLNSINNHGTANLNEIQNNLTQDEDVLEENDDPIAFIMNQTKQELIKKSGYPTGVKGNSDMASSLRGRLDSQFKKQSNLPGTVSDMLSSTRPIHRSEIADPENIGEIEVVPDFSNIMNKLKERGDI